MTRHVVFCWELGAGYGHIAGFLPVARELHRLGLRVTWLVRDLSNTGSFTLPPGQRLLQAPFWLPRRRSDSPVGNYSELLFRHGFLEPGGLAGLLRGWRNQFDLLAPDLVVFDHSPTALLASHHRHTPRALLGTGFFAPPPVSPWPSLRPWEAVDTERLRAADATLLGNINAALALNGEPALASLPALFEVDENFLCTFPELDHYRGRSLEAYWGPRMEVSSGEAPSWPAGEGPRLFAYLKNEFQGTQPVLDALGELGNPTLLHVAGLPDGETGAASVRNCARPVNMAAACREADAVICHAGHGTVSAALLAGLPVALLPTQQEQRMLANALLEYGLGVAIDARANPGQCAMALRELLTNPVYRRNAQAFARKYADFDHQEQVGLIAERCAELAGA